MSRRALVMIAAAAALAACSDNNDDNNAPILDAGMDADVGDLTDVTIDPDMDTPDTNDDDMGDDGGTTGLARLQVLHLATGAPAVDVYAGDVKIIEDLAPLEGTGFFPVTTGAGDLVVSLAAADSTDAATPITSFTVTGGLANGEAYTVAAIDESGEEAGVGFVTLADAALPVSSGPVSASDPVSLRILHASEAAGAVDIDVESTADLIAGSAYTPEVDNASFRDFTDYLELPSDAGLAGNIATLNVNASSGQGEADDASAFVAALQTPALAGLAGVPLVAAAVGDPADGSFRVVAFPASLEDGDLPVSGSNGVILSGAARLQVIHNSPGAEVDVYLGDALARDDFMFGSATPYLTLPTTDGATDPIGLVIRAGDDDGSGVPLFELADFALTPGTYVAVATLDATGALRVDTSAGREVDDDASNVLILGYHGAPTVGPVDLGGDSIIATNIPFGSFTDGYLEIPSEVTAGLISVWLTGTDDPILQTGTIDFSALEEVPLVGVISTDMTAAPPENKLLLFTPSGGPAVEYELTTP